MGYWGDIGDCILYTYEDFRPFKAISSLFCLILRRRGISRRFPSTKNFCLCGFSVILEFVPSVDWFLEGIQCLTSPTTIATLGPSFFFFFFGRGSNSWMKNPNLLNSQKIRLYNHIQSLQVEGSKVTAVRFIYTIFSGFIDVKPKKLKKPSQNHRKVECDDPDQEDTETKISRSTTRRIRVLE